MKTFIQRINNLTNYVDANGHNRDLIFDVIFKLRQSLEDASKNEFTKQELDDLIYSKNNCLATEGASSLPEETLAEIKNLQQEIVDTYGLQD